jgi:RNA recognition motif-containing protein
MMLNKEFICRCRSSNSRWSSQEDFLVVILRFSHSIVKREKFPSPRSSFSIRYGRVNKSEAIRLVRHRSDGEERKKTKFSHRVSSQRSHSHRNHFTITMPTKLYVGNIPSSVSSRELTELFEKYGKVMECDIIKDYAFVVRSRDH